MKGAKLKEGIQRPGASYQIMPEAISASCIYLSVTLCEPSVNSFKKKKKEKENAGGSDTTHLWTGVRK